MRNKFVSLILGLMVILVTPAFTAKYADDVKKDSMEQVEIIQPEVMNDSVWMMDVREMETPQLCCAGFFAFAQDGSPEISADDSADGEIVADDSGSLLSWQNIVIAMLSSIALLFGGLWERARRTIAAIDLALKDGSVDKSELIDIVNAWKGV